MGATRILKRNLSRSGDAVRYMPPGHDRKMFRTKSYGEVLWTGTRVWQDMRPRDEHGHLQGHCSKVAAAKRRVEELRQSLTKKRDATFDKRIEALRQSILRRQK